MIDQLAAYIIATAVHVLLYTAATLSVVGLIALSYRAGTRKRVYKK